MPDRRRQRHQRTRNEPGERKDPVGASNRDEPHPKVQEQEQHVQQVQQEHKHQSRPERQGGAGVAYAEAKQYESVTIMGEKEGPTEPQKYHRRKVVNNWSRYEELPQDEPDDGEDYMIGEDFAKILEQQASTGGGGGGGFFKFRSEKLWEDEAELSSHVLGGLNMADLVAAFNTIPLHEQMNIPEHMLPKSVINHYTNLADDHRKLYKPSTGYDAVLDVNEKILNSLRISEDEPLTLSNYEEEKCSTKKTVDVAQAFGGEFTPAPEDVDLVSVSLVREPSPEKRPSSRTSKGSTPAREVTPVKEASPVKESSPAMNIDSSLMQQNGTPKEQWPVKDVSPLKEIKPVQEATANPSVAMEAPKLDAKAVTPPRDQRKGRKEGRSPAPNQDKPETVKSENIASVTPSIGKLAESSGFEFEIPKLTMPYDFGLPKAPVQSESSKKIPDLKQGLELPAALNFETKEEAAAPEGPVVDLDATAKPEKPVLLMSKTEADDLEDWLDSVLDD